jgi:CRISPR system Cascade subunit CasE
MTVNLLASVLYLDRYDIRVLKVTDAYSLHRVVYSLFTDVRSLNEKKTSMSSGIQWADDGGNALERRILLLSNRHPGEKVLGRKVRIETKPIPVGFTGHNCYRFQVVVNPTRRENASRRLVPVRGNDAIKQWFFERAGKSWGFLPERKSLQINNVHVLKFKGKNARPVTLAQADVQGRMEVSDRGSFEKSFAHGIGRGRAFGCGLLRIVPITTNIFA